VRSARRAAIALCAIAAAACSSSSPAPAPSPVAPQPQAAVTTTALTVSAVNAPARLLGSDGKTHIEYDLMLQSMFDAPVTVTSIEVLAPDGASLLKLVGDDIAKVTTAAFSGPPTAVVPPSGALGTVIDLVVSTDEVPGRLNHRISYRTGTSEVGSMVGTRDIVGPLLDVDARLPTVIAAPLRGSSWLNANSCCVPDAPHRRGRIAVDGNSIKKFEEFAVDWVQLRDGKAFDGDGSRNEQWYGFGADVVAVADGSVAAVFDGIPEQKPDTPSTGLRGPRDYSGNHVSLQISPGVWAVYAHLQPGSITVKTGEDVKKGQVIGRLGNSGNSTGPHLHFQLSDGPEITTSNSLPFVLDSYGLAGAGQRQSNTYPLMHTVASF
jgi:hypothetical protein